MQPLVGDRVTLRFAVEPAREQRPVEQPRVEQHELFGAVEVDAQLGLILMVRSSRTIDPVANFKSGSMLPSTTATVSSLIPFSMVTRPRPTRTVADVRPLRTPKLTAIGEPR